MFSKWNIDLKTCISNSELGTLLTLVRDIKIFSKINSKISKGNEKHDLIFYIFFWVLSMIMAVNQPTKNGNGKAKFTQEKK